MKAKIEELCQRIAAGDFGSVTELCQALATILEEARSALEMIGVSVWLTDPQTGELVCQQAAGPGNETLRGWRLAPEIGIAGWVVSHGESVIVPDAWLDKRHFRGVFWQTRVEVRSILSLPLEVAGQTVGTLQVVDSAPNRFTPADLALVEPLAVAVASAAHKAQLTA